MAKVAPSVIRTSSFSDRDDNSGVVSALDVENRLRAQDAAFSSLLMLIAVLIGSLSLISAIVPTPSVSTNCGTLPLAQDQRPTQGAWTLARRRWQEGSVYLRRSKTLPDAWWGRYVETVETETGTVRIQRNVRLGDARQLTKPLAKRALREFVDRANNYQPVAVKAQTMGKAATPFSVFATRWQEEVLIHKKASTTATVKGHINNWLIPAFGKLAVGDIDSERVQSFLNRLPGNLSAKSVKNIWATLRIMWKCAVRWNYVTGELCVDLPKARKLRMRCYTVQEAKRILANTQGADQVFFWLAVESGARVGELIALRVSDVDLENLSVEFSKAIWGKVEDSPKTEASVRSICVSTQLGTTMKEYLAGRTDGYLFQTSEGNPWDASDTLRRTLNVLLKRLGIPKIDPKLLAKIIGKDRTISQATRSEKRAASLGMHSFRHTNVTAMDSLGLPEQIRKQRIGHSAGSVTESYTHTFTKDEREAADKLGEFFGTGWPEKEEGKLISFPSLSQIKEGLPASGQEALANQ
jgi:integrase